MKTFNEALLAVTKDLNEFHDKVAQTRAERISNTFWLSIITSMADISELRSSRTPREHWELTLHSLHIMFEFGLLVGMEMEKPE